VAHFPGVPGPLDREGFTQLGNVFTSAFPQSQTTIDDEIAEGDKVVSRWTYRAVHRGEFQGIPPAGKQVTMTGLTLLRIAGGKIVEHWVELDQLGLLQQLGVVPPAQETGA
jgi:predicted ester cyclase